jgi:class 3 adenylate cyclase
MDRRSAQLRRRRWLLVHLAAFALASGLLVAGYVMTRLNYEGIFGRAYPGLGLLWLIPLLAVALAVHVVYVLAKGPVSLVAIERDLGGGEPPAGLPRRSLATVLFTDIVGSTQQAGRLGDARWGELLDLHDRTTRELVARWRGRLVKLTGDGVLATFDTPERAIRCAAGLRARLAQAGLQIRAGLHTGEVAVRGRDVGGIAVHIGARVMAAAGGGEILVSRTVHDLVTGADIGFEDRGAYRLKGVEGDWQLFAVLDASRPHGPAPAR